MTPGLIRNQSVTTSTVIGISGATGTSCSGAHLHFSVRVGGSEMANVRNPEKWLRYNGQGKVLGSAWNGQGVDASSYSTQIKLVGLQKTVVSGYGSSYTYRRQLFSFQDAEDWCAAEVAPNKYTVTTSQYGTNKTLYIEVLASSRTVADFDVGNAYNDVDEFNEDRATATTMTPGTARYAYVFNSRDDDFYKVVPTSSGQITITLTNLPANYNLKLLNSTGGQLAISQNTGTTAESIAYSLVAGSTYYIQVYGYNGAFNIYNQYLLSTTFAPN